MSDNKHVIILRDVWFRYPRSGWVLKGVNLYVRKGESILVIGGTGSGKSTMARVLNGSALWIYNGELKGDVIVDGFKVREDSNPWVLARKIHVVGQNPYMYFINPLLREDLEFYAYSLYEDDEIAERALWKAVESVSARELLDKYFFELSGGQARRALVAKSMIADPEVIVFDEPLMWLDDKGVNEFLKLAEALRFMGKTLVFMEHRFMPLLSVVDKVYVMRNGVLEDRTIDVYRLKHETYPEAATTYNVSVNKGDPVTVLKAENVWYRVNGLNLLKGVDLTVSKGDLLYIYGENGSGKTTLLRILAGYLKPVKGRVWKSGEAVYVPQNIHMFYTEESITREIEGICRSSRSKRECIEKGLRITAGLNVDPSQPAFNLSHGQMVKLAVSLAGLREEVDIVLLDEPFSGLTYVDRVKLVNSLIGLGKAVVIAVSSSDILGYPPGSKTYRLENGVLQRSEAKGSTVASYASIAAGLLGDAV
ncbi:ATP-binding cassette domain-containing protein [Desulfurococcus amylolyticus]|uniref:ATP-binding cassette domain-containing protein n=1 Tax=Desulfurococcus amylolyticus TaxID=94694 RepID=UPI0009FE9B04|nr:ATP-binding cassette domain-containing protein [Desulfurococcus amylolyticus]